MKKFTEIEQKVEELSQVVCNKCGETCFVKTNSEDFDPNDYKTEYLEVDISWGYFSKKDGESHEWEICEKCYDKFVKSFKVPPKKESYL
jgi:hypothetical protein